MLLQHRHAPDTLWARYYIISASSRPYKQRVKNKRARPRHMQSASAAATKFETAGCTCQCPGRAALEAELEALKLKLFWKDHNKSQLELAMQYANQDATKGPGCACIACAVSGRMDEEQDAKGFDCTFKPYFEAKLKECGLTFERFEDEAVGKVGAHDAADWIYANDAHLVFLTDDWHAFSYGAKLWRAASSNDAELQKLARLFVCLETTEDNDG